MGRTAKKAPVKEIDESPTQTITQTRARRTPKPNPKYTNESTLVTPKIDSEEDPVGSDGEERPAAEAKVVKSTKKVAETPASVKATKTPAAKAKPVVAKKQKLDYDDDEPEITEDDKAAPAARATRSAKGGDVKDTIKVGDDSVAVVDVSSIIASKAAPAAKPESPKILRGAAGRKRTVPEESPKEDLAKKKKEEEKEKPSLITARKSYMPSTALAKKAEAKAELEKKEVELAEVKKEEVVEVKKEPLKPLPAGRPRRNAIVVESPPAGAAEPVLKKPKFEDVKVEIVKPEPKKLPMMRRSEITKMSPAPKPPTVVAIKPSPTLPMKTVVAITTAAPTPPKPVPRILNSMITPKGKQSPNVKLAGDGTDKKVFSIDLTDDSIKEKKILASPIKTPVKTPVAVKENVAINKPPQMVLKNKLESELIRMKASANMAKRSIPGNLASARQSLPMPNAANHALGPRRITKFESWYVIDVKNLEPTPFRHTHTHSLIKFGNSIKEVQLPSMSWDYKVTLQRRQPRKENNNEEEVYTGEVTEKTNEAQKSLFEPSSILFKRSHRESNKVTIDRSIMIKQGMYTITMNGKQCKLIGAPDDIKSIEDLELLISIVDSSSLQHSCVELVTNNDIICIS